ncbi:MAG: hypothetical protein CFE29_07245 [Bradyrhizobiaceae bacterium PARB1]|jgi:bacteriorhodopsin|nr:MAG: hypothetical protein CFE29_07245 [Bradyrhizobiaceae bacterium PARB1]
MTNPDDATRSAPSSSTKVGGTVLRTLFLLVLIVITFRVASPQREALRSLLETPADLIRVLLGLIVMVWLGIHIVWLPKDAGAYRTWSRMGFILLPLAVLCAYVVW